MLYPKLTVDFLIRTAKIKFNCGPNKNRTALYCPIEDDLSQFVILDQDDNMDPVVVKNQFGLAVDSYNQTGKLLISQDVTSYFPRDLFTKIVNHYHQDMN